MSPLHTRTALLASALVLSAATSACEGFIGGGSEKSRPKAIDHVPAGNVNPVDHPPLDPPLTSALPNRLSIEQLRRSVPVAMGQDLTGGPITWMVGSKTGYDANSGTLGEADFLDNTQDNLEPSPLYLKFADDAARDVCKKTLDADVKRTDKTTRSILRHVEKTDTVKSAASAVDDNLRYLKLRFHGTKLSAGDDTVIAPYRTMFDQVVTKEAAGATPTEAHVREGWHVVCVALLTAPEFHLY